ncbi:MAG: hypothetical protein JKY56_15835 [Kofleriaceae bacterium]|nr:hypothetical protein [Kofleriaceae bacterium]
MKITDKLHLRAVAIFISCCVGTLLIPGAINSAHAEERVAPSGGTTTDLLQRLSKATTAAERISLAKELASLGSSAVGDLKKHLQRNRKSSESSRRSVLGATGAAVPDKTGRFRIPKRISSKTQKKNDDFDWLAAIGKLSSRAGLADVVVDVAIIRALASIEDPAAGIVVLDFAFSEGGLIYRDECGRYLRKMSPYSLPALIRGSQNLKSKSMKRYSRYQLERLHRQNAHKAILAATDENLKISILTAFAESQYREAVFAVLDTTNHSAPRVRAAARAAWLEFATGKEPPKPPERKLALPNGEHTRNKEPLWLDHRVLATTAIRVRIKEVTGSAPNKRTSLAAMTETLFAHFDDEREAITTQDFEKGKAMASAGKPEQARAIFDRVLAIDPGFAKRGEMLGAYMAVAESLEAEEKWLEASVAYGKASAVASDNQEANAALKKHHLARAKAAGGSGEDAQVAMELAAEVDTSATEATTASIKKPSKLILFAGLVALAFAIILLILGVSRRRQSGV